MKTTHCIAILLLAIFCKMPTSKAQGILGIGKSGITGLPDSTHFGDTIRNMQVWVVNRGTVAVSGLTVQLLAAPNLTGSPFPIGTLDLTLGLLQPGDSASVPLDYFVVSPSNSNNGSNIMVIWPTSPGTSPGDSAHQDYWVDGSTSSPKPLVKSQEWSIFPNPSQGNLQAHLPQHLTGKAEISIFQMNGNSLMRRQFEENERIDLTHLPNGLYFYRLEMQGKVIADGKLVLTKD